MKKLILFLAAILLGVSSSFAQPGPTVKVAWDDANCSCVSLAGYFKVTISIYDDANSTWVIQDKTFNTPDGTYSEIVFDVPEVIEYCKDTHDFTPSFTVSATVWLILADGSECCTGSDTKDADCKTFDSNGQLTMDKIYLQ